MRTTCWASLALLAAAGLAASAPLAGVFQESGGIVVVEVEAEPAVPSWVSETGLAGYTGSAYHTWRGSDLFNSPGTAILRYDINISTPGRYTLAIRNRHDHLDSTLENDCFTRMDGGTWIKTYSSTRGQWTWHTVHEDGGNHLTPEYDLTAGAHTFEISARSANYSIDRFHLYLGTVANPLDDTRPPSSTTPGGGAPPLPGPAAQAVSSLTLIDADTDQPIAGFDPLNSGATLNLGTMPTRNWNLRANTQPGTVGSVRFGYDGNAAYRTESAAPYALEGDSGGNYNPWTPSVGSHSTTGTPYDSAGGAGAAGTPLTITFTVIDDPTTPSTNGTTPPPTPQPPGPTPGPNPGPGGTPASGPTNPRENDNGDGGCLGSAAGGEGGGWLWLVASIFVALVTAGFSRGRLSA